MKVKLRKVLIQLLAKLFTEKVLKDAVDEARLLPFKRGKEQLWRPDPPAKDGAGYTYREFRG